MMAPSKNVFRYFSVMICLFTVLSYFNIGLSAENAHTESVVIYNSSTSYSEYLSNYSDKAPTESPAKADLSAAIGTGEYTYRNRESSDFGLVLGETATDVQIPVVAESEGLYELELTYFPLGSSLSEIEISVMINGELPFTEAGYCRLSRTFSDTEIIADEDGHDISQNTEIKARWITGRPSDVSGINGNYLFYLHSGKNVLTVSAGESQLLISDVSFVPKEKTAVSYKEYKANATGTERSSNDFSRKFQAERLLEKSSSAITSAAERTSIFLEPFDYRCSRINVLDGSRWINPGDWVSWEIEVEENGYYNLGFKYRQNYLDGLYSSRDILIDGEIPFKELEAVHFNYTTQWAMKVPGEDEPYAIYLTGGKHILTLKNVLGDFAETLNVMESCVNKMNALYLDIIEITGSEPDTNRDYYLEEVIPGISDRFTEISEMLFDEAARLSEKTKAKGSETAVLENTAYQLKSYSENIDSLTNSNRISSFGTNITTLSSKIETLGKQGLDLDYIAVVSAGDEMPKCNPSFFEKLLGNIRLFLNSFSERYSAGDKDELRIWVSGGQEQLEIIRTLSREGFTAATGTPVSVELVSGSLQQAALAGNNPDVALNVDAGVPVNFALRGALTDISVLEGFRETEKQYRNGSFVPYTINGGVYGIPSAESFQMMFVRNDIFAQMGLNVPKTWDELLDLAPVLQRKNMHVGMGISFADLVFQFGGKYYNDALTDVCFNDNADVEAFKFLTSMFTDYGFPLTYDFLTRFRTGEIPIGIAPYSMYNSISYSAPELKGLWEMYELPGKALNGGNINNTGVASPITASIMFKNTKHKEKAWDFLEWWADSSVQTAYALKLESVMGVSARYNTANMITLNELPWTQSERSILKAQISKLKTLPILPGTYYVERCYNNAYRAVVNHGKNPREMLNKWSAQITEELARKQKEFDSNNK